MRRILLLVVLAGTLALTGLTAQTAPPNEDLPHSQPDVVARWQSPAELQNALTQQKRQWTQGHPGVAMDLPTFAQLAAQAFSHTKNSAQHTIDNWQATGNTHPWVMVPEIAVSNPTEDTAWLNVTVQARLEGHLGPWLVDDQLYLTDVEYMRTHGEWVTLAKQQWFVPAFAPGQTVRWPLPALNVAEILSRYIAADAPQPTAWLDELRLRVEVSRPEGKKQTFTKILQLEPDIFAVSFW